MKLVSSDSWLGMLMLDMSVKTLLWYTGRTSYHQDKRAARQTPEEGEQREETAGLSYPSAPVHHFGQVLSN